MLLFTLLTIAARQRHRSEEKDEGRPEPSLTNPEVQKSRSSPMSLSTMAPLLSKSSQTAAFQRIRAAVTAQEETSTSPYFKKPKGSRS